MIWLDYLILIMIGWGAINGYNRGFIPVLLRLSGTLFAVVISTLFAQRIADLADARWDLKASLSDWLGDRIGVEATTGHEIAEPAGHLPSFSETITDYLSSGFFTGVAETLVPSLVSIILVGGAFIVTFLCTRMLIGLIEGILDRMLSAVIGDSGSAILGLIAGAAQNAIICCLGLVALYALTVIPPFEFMATSLQQSTLAAIALSIVDSMWPHVARSIIT